MGQREGLRRSVIGKAREQHRKKTEKDQGKGVPLYTPLQGSSHGNHLLQGLSRV